MTAVRAVANNVTNLSSNVDDVFKSLGEQAEQIEKKIDLTGEELQSVRARQSSTGKLILVLLVLSLLQATGFVILALFK